MKPSSSRSSIVWSAGTGAEPARAMSEIVYLDGEYLPRGEARVSVEDRGFLFGDGVYEVSPAYEGTFLRLDRHLARMARGLRSLQISLGVSELEEVHRELMRRNGLEDEPMSVVYLQVTRGVATRTHHFPPPATRPTVFAYGRAFHRPDPAEWIEGYGAITYPDRRWSRADLKTLQLLPSVMAQEAARHAGEKDAILVRDGIALEGSHNNLFFVFDGTIRTHPPSNQILPGITRELVLEIARSRGLEVEERPTPVEEVVEAREIFFTGTTTEIRPTVRVNGHPVGNGRVGPVTRALYEAFLERVTEECGLGGSDGGKG
jgi:D-alanine transaminase